MTMKALPLFIPLLSVCTAGAQVLDLSGEWVVAEAEFLAGGLGYSELSLSEIEFVLDSSNSVELDDESLQFGFDDGLLVAISDEGVSFGALSQEVDTLCFTGYSNFFDFGGFFEEVNLNLGVRRPTHNFTSEQLSGRWIGLVQTTVSSQESGDPSEDFVGIYHAVEQVDFNLDGSFQAEVLEVTSSEAFEPPFGGSWQALGKGMQLTMGAEVFELENISAGADTGILADEEFSGGPLFDTVDRSFRIIIKEPVSLSEADLLGSWVFNLTRLQTLGDPEALDQTLVELDAEYGRLELLPDGVAKVQVLNSSSEDEDGAVSTFSWSVQDKLLLLEEGDELLSFYVSAGFDFAATLSFEDEGFNQLYETIILCKANDTDKLFPSIPSISAGGNVEVTTGSQPGLNYQLERSQDLVTWDSVGAPVLGSGNEIIVSDNTAPAGLAFYRWRVVRGVQ